MGTLTINYLPQAALIVACGVAAISDVRTRRIPNAIPIALALIALVTQLRHGIVPALIAVAIGLGILILGTGLFAVGWMGGGDIKLLAAGAMIAGPSDALHFVFYSLMAGGVLALITLALRKQALSVLSGVFVRFSLAKRNPKALLDTPQTRIVLPYALAIAAGALAATFYTALPGPLRIT